MLDFRARLGKEPIAWLKWQGPKWPQPDSGHNSESLHKITRQSTPWFLSSPMHIQVTTITHQMALCMPRIVCTQQLHCTENILPPPETNLRCSGPDKTAIEWNGFQARTELRQRQPRSSTCKVLQGSLFENDGLKTAKLLHWATEVCVSRPAFILVPKCLSCNNLELQFT